MNNNIIIENVIGWDITASEFSKQIISKSKKSNSVNIIINSVGGSVYDGLKMFTDMMIAVHDGVEVNTYNDGMAASMASVIAISGTRRFTQEHSTLMIHNPSSLAFGDDDDMEAAKSHVKIIKERIASIYSRFSNIEEPELIDMMKKETWLDSKSQKESGFADHILFGRKPVAKLDKNKSKNIEKMPKEMLMLFDKSKSFEEKLYLGLDIFQTSKRKTIELWTKKS